MVKTSQTVKKIEAMAVDAVRDLLGCVPNIEISEVRQEQILAPGYCINGWIAFSHGGINYALIIAIKADGSPRFARSAVYQLESYMAHALQSNRDDVTPHLIPMVVSSYLSSESRSICTDHNVACLDLVGNAYLSFDSVYIERSVADRPKSETRALRSMFAPKAAAILRALLRDPDRAWRVTDLAEAANASLGHVSNVRKALLAREWIEKQHDGVVLVQPNALLKTWRENYRQPTGQRISGYTHLHGEQLGKRLSGKLNPHPQRPRAIYSSNSSAQWLAPFVRGGTHNFYADEPGARMLKETLKLTHAAKGANVILRIPNDESLFEDAVQPAPDIFCTSPIITYLDLWNGNDRDREAADHIATKCFPWL